MWNNRQRDMNNVMFAVNYEDGRTAYILVPRKDVQSGDHLVTSIARERQEQGEIPEGSIRGVKRVR